MEKNIYIEEKKSINVKVYLTAERQGRELCVDDDEPWPSRPEADGYIQKKNHRADTQRTTFYTRQSTKVIRFLMTFIDGQNVYLDTR